MRLAFMFLLTLLLVGPALAQGDASESVTSQQGGAVHAMGRVGHGKKAARSGIEIPNYGGNISAVRRLPLGTTSPRSRSFVRAPRYFAQRFTVSGQFEPSFFAAYP